MDAARIAVAVGEEHPTAGTRDERHAVIGREEALAGEDVRRALRCAEGRCDLPDEDPTCVRDVRVVRDEGRPGRLIHSRLHVVEAAAG